jgi:collagenase-like PrtC family protease
MENLELSVPYNSDTEILPELFKLKRVGNNIIREIYLCGPQEYSGSGRVMPEINLDEFTEIVDKIHKEGIRVNLILNSTCEGTDWYSTKVVNSTMDYLRQVHEEHGVEAVTIANPLYISMVRERFPDIEICASVLGDIDCVQRAVIYKKAGADVITPDVNINRDLKLLKEIKEVTGAELKLMVNEGCLYKCPFRKFHFNATSHASKEVSKVGLDVSFVDFFGVCNQVIGEDHSQILKSCWVRPEDTGKYGEITSFFKIVGRNYVGSRVTRATKAYLEESWGGDLLDILCASIGKFSLNYGAYLYNKVLDERKFFEKVTACGHRCGQCSYCANLADELIELGVYTIEKTEDISALFVT